MGEFAKRIVYVFLLASASIQGMWRAGMFPAPLGLLNLKHLSAIDFAAAQTQSSTSTVNHPDYKKTISVIQHLQNQDASVAKCKSVVPVSLGPRIATQNTHDIVKKIKEARNVHRMNQINKSKADKEKVASQILRQ
jgi:hypothetical protein